MFGEVMMELWFYVCNGSECCLSGQLFRTAFFQTVSEGFAEFVGWRVG